MVKIFKILLTKRHYKKRIGNQTGKKSDKYISNKGCTSKSM